MRKLYLHIYLSFVAGLLLFAVLLAFAWWLLPDPPEVQREREATAALVAELLPPPDASPEEVQARLQDLARRYPADLAVRGADGRTVAAVGAPLPEIPPGRDEGGWIMGHGERGAIALRLPDGRWVLARGAHRHRGAGLIAALALLAVALGIGAYPIARRITRRVERLQSQVEALGAGNLSARVEVQGSDEVAELAASFNRSAERIERLVGAHRALLASVSHELRTPLSRLRMAIALLEKENRPDLKAQVERNIAELDELIGELLLASRLDAVAVLEGTEDVDLLALVAEEGARSGADVSGDPVTIRGDPRLLRRLARNLLENARRHAPGVSAEASVRARAEGGAWLRVADRGPGVPESARERIFEPFYRLPASERQEGGSGLGLALVRRIARRHGGEVRCLPRDGGGTVFEVELPGA
ncbi:MAG TPA: HAMP domain-containing sensor histidine kinase [Burkholderiales bacterium]|nr:HAMP domain-containing sensor histidine kinase [Burkholderiales bacterium]